jgi:hypothetical protein
VYSICCFQIFRPLTRKKRKHFSKKGKSEWQWKKAFLLSAGKRRSMKTTWIVGSSNFTMDVPSKRSFSSSVGNATTKKSTNKTFFAKNLSTLKSCSRGRHCYAGN